MSVATQDQVLLLRAEAEKARRNVVREREGRHVDPVVAVNNNQQSTSSTPVVTPQVLTPTRVVVVHLSPSTPGTHQQVQQHEQQQTPEQIIALSLKLLNGKSEDRHIQAVIANGKDKGCTDNMEIALRLNQRAMKFRHASLTLRLQEFFKIYEPSKFKDASQMAAAYCHDREIERRFLQHICLHYGPKNADLGILFEHFTERTLKERIERLKQQDAEKAKILTQKDDQVREKHGEAEDDEGEEDEDHEDKPKLIVNDDTSKLNDKEEERLMFLRTRKQQKGQTEEVC